jgi:hypothetical protein
MADDQHRRMRGKVFPIRGHRRPRLGACSPAPPGTWRPTVQWSRQGGGAGKRSRGRGAARGFAARPPRPSCLAEYTSITAGRTLGVTDQDLRQSEAWLRQRRRLAGVIRAVFASPPPQAHRHGRGLGEHLARPRRGAGGRFLCRPPQGVDESRTNNWPGCGLWRVGGAGDCARITVIKKWIFIIYSWIFVVYVLYV